MASEGFSGTVVLVHGGFVDGSGWEGVYSLLKKDGYDVKIVQNPTMSLEGDVAATNFVIDAQDEPVILVGHSYGGAVVTEAGNNFKVAALVYIAALRSGQGRVGQHPHRGLPDRRPAAADPAAAGRLLALGPGQVPRLVRG